MAAKVSWCPPFIISDINCFFVLKLVQNNVKQLDIVVHSGHMHCSHTIRLFRPQKLGSIVNKQLKQPCVVGRLTSITH